MTDAKDPETNGTDNPNVAVHPPVLVLGCLLAAVVLEGFLPTAIGFDALRGLVGTVVCVVALVIFVLAIRRFRQSGTNVQTSRPSTTVVTDGVYRFTRNPIYLSMCLFMAGLGLVLDNLWVVLSLALIVPVLRYGVIAREETYLERKFGASYLEYKKSARRWL